MPFKLSAFAYTFESYPCKCFLELPAVRFGWYTSCYVRQAQLGFFYFLHLQVLCAVSHQGPDLL